MTTSQYNLCLFAPDADSGLVTGRVLCIKTCTCACSFAIVIQSLPSELRDAVCIFYLVLRALDTVEDDMAIAVDVKVPLLRVFHEKIYDR